MAFQAEWVVSVDGSPLPVDKAQELMDLRIERSIQLPDMAVIRVSDPSFEILDAATFPMGAELEIAMTSVDGETGTPFTGEVTGITVEPSPAGQFELVVTALDLSHRLARVVHSRTFIDQSDSEIVTTIAGEHGLTASVDSTATVQSFVLQRGTDAAYLTERAHADGYRWWVEGTTLNFKEVTEPTDSGIILTWGVDLISFRVRTTAADAAGAVEVRSWDPGTQSSVVGSATPSADLANGLASDATAATSISNAAATFGGGSRIASLGGADQEEADTIAKAAGRRVVSSQVSAHGIAELSPGLAPGTSVTIEGMGESLSGSYALTKVEHVIGDRGFITRFTCDGIDAADLVGLLNPPPPASGVSAGELMIGIVTNIEDSESPPRVKVKFPTLSDDDESAWARLVLPGAGASRGLQIMPEVNDEVLVGFEQGDVRRPVVLGGLWSSVNAPPIAATTAVQSGEVSVRSLTTRLGHQVTLVDGGDGDKIEISMADGKGSVVLDDNGITVTTPGELTVSADGDVSITAGGDVNIEGTNVKVKATSEVGLQGATFKAKADSTAAIEGVSTSVKGTQLALEGSATTGIKGGMVSLN